MAERRKWFVKWLHSSPDVRSGLLAVIAAILVASLVPAVASAESFRIDGIVNVVGNGVGSVYRIQNGPEVTTLSDYAEISGINGQLAISKYVADLATGHIGAYSYAQSDYERYAYSAAAFTTIDMRDTLNFHVPAGTYTDGLTVTLFGSISGLFSSLGQAEESGRFQAIFGNETYDLADYIGWDSYNGIVNGTFALTSTILPPSPSPRPDLTVSKGLRLTLSAGRPLGAHAYRTTDYGEALADFYDSIRITSVAVPVGVTWDSDSGVLLTQTAVPEPSTALLLVSGLVGLAAFRRMRFFGN